jgi:glycine/D-amino acid oxidase-like deaminating enzyme
MSGPADIAVVGGGLVGASLALGFARAGADVMLFDAGEDRFHASGGNFGLIWVQGKGLSSPEYAALSRRSARAWADFAHMLEEASGNHRTLAWRAGGGIEIALEADEMRVMAAELALPGSKASAAQLLDARELRELVPAIGREVLGGTYCPDDGHVDPLATLGALHRALRRAGVRIVTGKADKVTSNGKGRGFVIATGAENLTCERVVIAAGLGSVALCGPLGLTAALRPQRGQIVVTERAAPFLDLACVTVRQTGDGTVLLGDSKEEAGFSTATTPQAMAAIMNRAVRCFPHLAGLRVVRAWAALRVLTPDGLPVYQTSARYPGASLVTCHSGVTLAAAHAGEVADAILSDRLNETYPAFSSDRFCEAA